MSSRFRTKFDRRRVAVDIDPSERRTKSEFKADTDINQIVARYRRTRVLPDTARQAAARYGDFSEVPTYHEMFDRVLAAEEMFQALPASVRKAFGNDPGRFIAASETPEGQKLMVKLGLATARPSSQPSQEESAPVPSKAPKSKDETAGGDGVKAPKSKESSGE